MQRPAQYEWNFDSASRDMNTSENAAVPSSSSTSSGSPGFSMVSTSPLDATNGSRIQDYGHIVGEHRRHPSSSRASNSTENIYNPLGQRTTPPSRSSFDHRHHAHGQHPYAFPTSLPSGALHGFAGLKQRKFPSSLDPMSEDRLEDLWLTHGVTGSAHLGLGLTDQLAASRITGEEWRNGSPSNIGPSISEVLEQSAYFDAALNSDQLFTVDPSLQQNYDVHNPFNLFGSVNEADGPLTAEMELVDDHTDSLEDSPHSEEQEVPSGRRSTSADSNVTAGPFDAKQQADATGRDEHEEEGEASVSDHENHDDDDKAHSSKPTTNNFVNKLHLMISDPKAADFIWWTELGTSFVVSSAGEFSRSILGQHFKHNNFSSFVRQLNMYGFHKINRTPRNQRVQPDAQQWEFSHPKFLRGRQDLLDDIKRKPVEPDPSNARQRVELPSEVAAKLRQMSLDHEEVVNALQVERVKVAQLASIVKVLYDRLALSVPLPVQFPHELLDARPLARDAAKQVAMDISGDSLVPSRNAPASTNAGTRGRQPPAQQTTATRSSRRTRTDPEGSHDARPSAPKSHTTGPEAFSSVTRQGPSASTWPPTATQGATGVNSSKKPAPSRPPDSSQMVSQLQVKHEANLFVR